MTTGRKDSKEKKEAFLAAVPPRDPSWILEALGIEPLPPGAVEEAPAPPMDREEIDELMRKLLHDELERFGLLDRTDPE